MPNKLRFFMLIAFCTMSVPALAEDKYVVITTDTSISSADTSDLTKTDNTTALNELKNLFDNQDPATNKVPLSNNFNVKDNKKDISELSFISHPDIAVEFFKICTDQLKGYVSISFDTIGDFRTRLSCFTTDSLEGYDETPNSDSAYAKLHKAKLDYGTKNCKAFDSIIPTPMPAPYNAKYGPQLSQSSSNSYLDVNVDKQRSEYRTACYISFPTPIPAGKKIIELNADEKFAKAKQICESNKGTFVIDDYTAVGRSRFATKNSLYKFALCIFTTAGDVNAQLNSEPWEYANDLKRYKDKLPSGQKFNPDTAAGKRCQTVFSKKDVGDANYLGQTLPMGQSGTYTACHFSIIDQSHNGEVFE